jgi:hypothetical protein
MTNSEALIFQRFERLPFFRGNSEKPFFHDTIKLNKKDSATSCGIRRKVLWLFFGSVNGNIVRPPPLYEEQPTIGRKRK